MGRPIIISKSVLLIIVLCCHTSLSLRYPPRKNNGVHYNAAVDGGWSCWITFGECSKTCGKGDIVRYRVCNNPRPSISGKYCVGERIQRTACNSHACPAHGGWSDWIDFGECSKSCGKGERISYKRCNNPVPNEGGKTCTGESVKRFACNIKPCPAMKDCHDYYKDGQKTDGVYTIQPDGKTTMKVYCDMTGGGWTVIHKRFDGSTTFFDKLWTDYKRGFGDTEREYWLGLENIHLLTKIKRSLKVELKTYTNNDNYVAHYSTFRVGDERSGYKLTVDGYSGNAGEYLKYNSGSKFSTLDKDNDRHSSIHCAQEYGGPWWHKDCGYSSLNGQYRTSRSSSYSSKCMRWTGVDGNYPLRRATMKLR